ncbi:lyase [Streptomyces sp. SID89]|nr:lyase [Streptomyces sp. SID89]
MTPALSRRSVLRAAGTVTLATGIALALPAGAFAADQYDTLRLKWRELLLGSGLFDAAEPMFAGRLADLGNSAQGHWDTMAPATGSLWPDQPWTSSSSGDQVTASYERLKTMALAYSRPGTGLTGDSSLATAIAAGLDHIHAQVYNTTYTAGSGWWWNTQIGAAHALLDVCVLMYDRLTADRIAAYCASVDHFLPDSRVSSYTGQSTGANRVDFCRTYALRGVVGKNSAKIALGRDALSPVFPFVAAGDGFHTDGSFIQHTYVPYTGSYGSVLLGGLAWLFALLKGSAWEITDPGRQLILDSVERSFAPFVYNGLLMDGVCGRAVSRGLSAGATYPSNDHTRAHGLMASILLLGLGASASEQARWKAMVKGWLDRDAYVPLPTDQFLDVPSLGRLASLQDDSTVTAAAEPVEHRLFPKMARAVHRRPAWAASLSMSASDITFYENGNGENLRAWHTGNGMLYWWGGTYGLGQYSDAFWPTVDPYRLPGATVSRKTLSDGEGGQWGVARPSSTWVGGATDGEFAAVGMDVRGLSSTLVGRKSWFFVDDAVICLGGGIRCTDGTGVESIVDNRNLGASGSHALTVDGVAQPSALGWNATFPRASWATIAGFGGYVFPGGASVKALREERTGSWHDINTLSGSTTPLTRRYLTLWFDHGTDPAAGSYAYVLLPGADPATTAARAAAAGWLTVLANTVNQQGVSVPSLGLTAVNFYGGGTVGKVSATAGVSVMIRESWSTATICVADPTRQRTTVDVTWNRPVGQVTAKDPSVTVLGTGTSVSLRIDLDGKAGATQKATVTLA